jgi:hypothetical protein
MPKRIQRRRTKGWRMPPNTRYVGRGSKWGNCFDWQFYMQTHGVSEREAKQWAKDSFAAVWTKYAGGAYKVYLDLLRGQDVACWCGLNDPCHGDVLIDLANPK